MCDRVISGTYYRAADNNIYCEKCWKSNHVCSMCGKLVKSIVTVDGHEICASCYAKIDVCDYCGKPLIGSYTQYAGLSLRICPECEKTLPRCQGCGIPVKSPVKSGSAILCERCAQKVVHCHSCGEPLLQDYGFFEGNKDLKYCLNCMKLYPRCDDCGAPIGRDGTTLDDGRHLCSDCRHAAYFDPALVTPIKERVFAFVRSSMGMPVTHDIDFSLRDRKYLNNKTSDIHGDLNGLFYRRGDDYYIYVLYGLREKDLICVIAHEITHAWEAENCSDDMELIDQEGFAQWVAYKALNYFSLADFANLMKEGDTVYSTGLVKMLELEKKSGASGVFYYMKHWKKQ